MSEKEDVAVNASETMQEAVNASVSIVHQVFGAFADALADQPERSTVAERLRKALITDGAQTEAPLRAALFESGAA